MRPNSSVKPWARGPLELLQHAEEHRVGRRDFDRRVALIGFDNAIESSVITYLSLSPVQRGGRTYQKTDVERWLANFHTKVAFLEHFASSVQRPMPLAPAEFIFYHQLRNELYHNGNGMVPAAEHIDGARLAAIWTFSTLFECDAETLIAIKSDSSTAADKEPTLSASTTFLQSFIETKKELDDLLAAMNKTVRGQSGLDRLLRLLQEDEKVPDAVVEATLQAERAAELVVRGDDTVVGDNALQALATGLDTATDYFRERLRSYQHEIVQAAVESTVAALRSDGRAGVVSQVLGTGLTFTVLAYLARCREMDELSSLPTIVIADRRDVCNQLVARLRDLPALSEPMSALIPESSAALNDALRASQPNRLLVTTWQQLRAMNATAIYNSSCLIVCFKFAQIGALDVDMQSLFPRGTFILFYSGPFREDERRLSLFGHLIHKYDYPAALVDGSLLPVRVEQRTRVAEETEHVQPYSGTGGRQELTTAQVHFIASDLVRDFDKQSKDGKPYRAIVVVRSRLAVTALHNELSRLDRERSQFHKRRGLVVKQLEARAAFDTFDERGSSTILVSTVELLGGLDFGPNVKCYVCCKISMDAQMRLISLVARPRNAAQGRLDVEGLLVDYADNQWDFLNAVP